MSLYDTTTPAPTGTPATGFDWGSFAKSPGGAALINAIGGGLGSYGQYQQNQQQLQQSGAAGATNAIQNNMALQAQRSTAAMNGDPLGADQQFAQRNAILSGLLPNLSYSKPSSGDAAIPQGKGGFGGGISFDPSMVSAMFGPNATMASIAQRHNELSNVDPNAPTADLGSMYGAQSAPYQQKMQAGASASQGRDAAQQNQLQQYIQQMAQQEQASGNSGGFWSTLAKIAGVGLGVGAMFVPGLQGVGLAAAGGALGAFGSNSNPLMGAVIGGGTKYAANAAGKK